MGAPLPFALRSSRMLGADENTLARRLLDIQIEEMERKLRRLCDLKDSLAVLPMDPDLSRPEKFDLRKFDPRWKNGVNLSNFGRTAILEAYKRGMGQSTVKALFHISAAAACRYHNEHLKRTMRQAT